MTANMLRTLVTAAVFLGVVSGPRLGAQGRQRPPLILDSILGRDSFRLYCAPCHGTTARGDGPVGVALKVSPPDLTALARANGGAFPRDRVRAIITGAARPIAAHGSPEMPVWGVVFRGLDSSEARVRLRIEGLVGHIETLQASIAPGRSGEQLFRTYCATCHGQDGQGNGPLAGRLRHAPPDLTRYTQRNDGVFPSERVHRIIEGQEVLSHGDREMPVWGDAFRSEPEGLTADQAKARVEAIVEYLRAMQRRDAE